MYKKLLFVILIMAIAILACGETPTPKKPEVYAVQYKVTGTVGRASLTYENETGGTEQHDIGRLPWTLDMTVGSGAFLYIAAQADGKGTITCKIFVDGKLYKESTSEGKYVISSCSGMTP